MLEGSDERHREAEIDAEAENRVDRSQASSSYTKETASS